MENNNVQLHDQDEEVIEVPMEQIKWFPEYENQLGYWSDEESREFVDNLKVGFKNDIVKSDFEIEENPQAESNCSCGASFTPKL